ncbi:MAG: hypothetical protein JXR03_03905 [Cyclobacteriaceae bacterium]
MGTVIDSASMQSIESVHVLNLNQRKLAISDIDGNFSLSASIGDTLLFSVLNYKVKKCLVVEEHFLAKSIFYLTSDTIKLDEIIITSLPSEEEFKNMVLNHKDEEESFWYNGVERPDENWKNPLLEEKNVSNPLFLISHPLSGFYYKFSKQEKEKREFHRIEQKEINRNKVDRKFTREWVSEVTELSGDELTYFIAYCEFSAKYLEQTSLYIIREDILEKLISFKESKKD